MRITPGRSVFSALACLLLAAPMIARAQSSTVPTVPATPQVAGPIDENRLAALPNNAARLAPDEVDEGPVAGTLPQNHILMLLRRNPAREAALEKFMKEQYDPQSPSFHKWLTPDQFGQSFGPSTQDIHQVTQWLIRHGFTVNRVPAGRTFIDFSGTAGQVETAFHTPIHHFRRNGNDHYSNTQTPSIPAALAQVVSGFRALNNFHPHPLNTLAEMVRLRSATGTAAPGSEAARGHFTASIDSQAFYLVTPQDFAQIYNIKLAWQQTIQTPGGTQNLVGTGQTIGIPGDTVLHMSEVQSFRDQFGLTALGPNGAVVVNQPPAGVCTAPPSNADDPEGYLDVEWAGATAPDATVDFVACADDGVTAGADLAAAYIVQDSALAQQVEILSTSYGYCEEYPMSETDDFYVQLWQQAAAEGITVIVASGDAGGAECDDDGANPYASQGLWVNSEASTPYNIAAGGTDFSDAFSGTISQYWSQNNSSTFQSAISYIPETPWNETCGNPLNLASAGAGFTTSYGPNGFCTYASEQPVDPVTGVQTYFYLAAGSGGLSTVSARPPWQTGVYGIPQGNARALPDISLFSAGAISSVHALVFCDATFLSAATCDYSNSEVLSYDIAGGTSFAAPSFAGIMALIDQKSGERQGQANYVLYALAGAQLVENSGAMQPSLANCAAYLGTGFLQSCYFHDISGTPNPDPATSAQTPFYVGNTSVPCIGSATSPGVYTDASTGPASNYENCYDYEITVTQSGTSLTTTPNYYGVTSTADNDTSPAFPATPGYDLATGLGSPNVAALVNAPQWSLTGPLAATTTVASTTLTQNQAVTALIPVTGSGGAAPLIYSVSPTLPAGLAMASGTGTITGTPTVTSPTTTYTVTVTDYDQATATATFSLTVDSAVAATTAVASTTLTVYQTVAAFTPVAGSGGTAPLTYSVSPTLPAGLTMASSTGAIAGAPTVASAATVYTVTVTDANQASATAAFRLTVAKEGSITTVSASSTSVTPVQSVTLTAGVSPVALGSPTGTVTFLDNGTQLGSAVALANGTATLVAPGLPSGQQAITAVYSGDADFLASTSTTGVTITVAPLDFSFTVAGAAAQTVAPGSGASFGFTLTPTYVDYPGPVTFTVSGLPPGATYTTSTTSVGSTAGPQSITLTVQTAPATARNTIHNSTRRFAPFAFALLLPIFGLCNLGLCNLRRSGRRLAKILSLVVVLSAGALAMSSLTGCGGGTGSTKQPSETYTVTVTAASGGIQHSAVVTLNVE